MTADDPLQFIRTTEDDGCPYAAHAHADCWLIGLSALPKGRPITLSHGMGAMYINIDLTAQHARAIAAELLAMADRVDKAEAARAATSANTTSNTQKR